MGNLPSWLRYCLAAMALSLSSFLVVWVVDPFLNDWLGVRGSRWVYIVFGTAGTLLWARDIRWERARDHAETR